MPNARTRGCVYIFLEEEEMRAAARVYVEVADPEPTLLAGYYKRNRKGEVLRFEMGVCVRGAYVSGSVVGFFFGFGLMWYSGG